MISESTLPSFRFAFVTLGPPSAPNGVNDFVLTTQAYKILAKRRTSASVLYAPAVLLNESLYDHCRQDVFFASTPSG
ncbi:hypothetical protein MTO96_013298 [Rhipicephalus appendiculatus]